MENIYETSRGNSEQPGHLLETDDVDLLRKQVETLLLNTQGEFYEKDLQSVIRTCSRTDLEKLLKTLAQKKLPPQKLKLSEFNFSMRNFSPLQSSSSSLDKIQSLQNSPIIHRLNSPLKSYKNSEISHYSSPNEGILHGSLERKQRFELKKGHGLNGTDSKGSRLQGGGILRRDARTESQSNSPDLQFNQRRASYDNLHSSNQSLNKPQSLRKNSLDQSSNTSLTDSQSYSRRKNSADALLNKKRHPRNSSTESLQSDDRWKTSQTSDATNDRIPDPSDNSPTETESNPSYPRADDNSRTLSFKSLESQTSSQDILYYLQQEDLGDGYEKSGDSPVEKIYDDFRNAGEYRNEREQRNPADNYPKHLLSKEQNHSFDNLLKSNLKKLQEEDELSSSMPELNGSCRKGKREKKDRSVRFQVEESGSEEEQEERSARRARNGEFNFLSLKLILLLDGKIFPVEGRNEEI